MAHIVNISGVIGWDTTPQGVRESLAKAGGEEVEVHVSSPGGYISDGIEIFNLLRDYQGPINGVLKGYAMSMGSYIPLAIPLNRHAPGKLSAEDNAIYMIHRARGGVWGDDNKIMGYGEALKGMSTMIAKAYAKRTGKKMDDLLAMMDKETFFFGEQIKEHGFVDEIIDAADDDTDAETARAQAQTMYHAAVARMVSDPARMESDLAQVAQMLASAAATPAPIVTPPAAPAAGNHKQEVQQMGLKELLAANPAAQAEYDKALAEAKAAGVAETQETVKACAPFLNNANYPKQVGEMAIKVLTGEQSKGNLDLIVATADMLKEQDASKAAQTAAADTPPVAGQPPAAPAAEQGLITDEATLMAELAREKGGA